MESYRGGRTAQTSIIETNDQVISSIIQMITYIDGRYTKDMHKQKLLQEHNFGHYIHSRSSFPLHITTQNNSNNRGNLLTTVKRRCTKLLINFFLKISHQKIYDV